MLSIQVGDAEFESAEEVFPFNPPKTKEAFYYRQIFEKHFPGHAEWIPYIWKSKWCGDIKNPSARLPAHYVNRLESLRRHQEIKNFEEVQSQLPQLS